MLWPMLLITTLGLGLGLCMQPITLAVQNAAKAQQIGVATSTATFTRQIGGTLGTAVFMSLLFARAPGYIVEALDRHSSDPAFNEALEANPELAAELSTPGELAGVLEDSSFLNDLDPVLARPFLEGFDASMQMVFIVSGLVMIAAFIMMWLMPELPLRNKSAYAERQAASAAKAAAEDAQSPST